MSKDFRHGQKQLAKGGIRQAFAESVSRGIKPPSERRIKDVLKRAVRLRDVEALEDYDERDIG